MRCHLRPEEGIRFHGLELQVAMSHLMWVLRTKPGSSAKATSILNQSLAPSVMKELGLTMAAFQVKGRTIKGRGLNMTMLMPGVGGSSTVLCIWVRPLHDDETWVMGATETS